MTQINKKVRNKKWDIFDSRRASYHRSTIWLNYYIKIILPINIFFNIIYCSNFLQSFFFSTHSEFHTSSFMAIRSFLMILVAFFIRKHTLQLDHRYTYYLLITYEILRCNFLSIFMVIYIIKRKSFWLSSNDSFQHDKILNNLDTALDTTQKTQSTFSVEIYDAYTKTTRSEIREINVNKFPPEKFATRNTYYAIESFKDGKKVRTFYAKNTWEEKIKESSLL